MEENKIYVGICDVHRLVYDDKTNRYVEYCSMCDAWICEECSKDSILRARAWAIQKKNQIGDSIKSFFS